MKALTKEQWRTRHIFNPYTLANAAGGLKVFIDYRPQDRGRASVTAAWVVVRIGYRTDPDGFWRDDGHKTFNLWHGSERQQRLDEATAWASERYGITAWERSPFGSWHPEGTMAAARLATEQVAR